MILRAKTPLSVLHSSNHFPAFLDCSLEPLHTELKLDKVHVLLFSQESFEGESVLWMHALSEGLT